LEDHALLAALPSSRPSQDPAISSTVPPRQILGAPVTAMEPSGPEPDEDTGPRAPPACTRQEGNADGHSPRFPQRGRGARRCAANLEPAWRKKETAKEESGGPGDKSYVVYDPNAAEYVVLKGATVLTLAVGGVPNPLPSYEAQLRSSAAAAAKKL
jgi:hypothetical protein